MEVDLVFRTLAAFARASADLYLSWAEAFGDDREAAALWGKMATEETGHANLVAYQRRVLKKSARLTGDVEAAMEEITMPIGIVGRALERPSHSLDEAVRLAVWMEGSASGSELQGALVRSNPEVQRLLGHLGADDRAHVQRLKDFAVRRAIPLLSAPGSG